MLRGTIILLFLSFSFCFATPVTNNLRLWLKADAITGVNNGSQVSTWQDQSGLGNNAASSGSSRPTLNTTGINGVAALQFDGSDDFLSIAGTNDYNFAETTMFVVSTNTVFSVAKSGTQTQNEFLLFGQTVFHHTQDGNFRSKNHQDPISGAFIAAALIGANPTDIDYRVNGVDSTQPIGFSNGSSVMPSVARSVTIGRRTELTNREPQAGLVAEIILYAGKLSTTEVEQVEAYLSQKYSIANLSSPIPEPTTYSLFAMGLLVLFKRLAQKNLREEKK